MPTQLDPALANGLNNLVSAVTDTAKGVMISNFVFNLFLGGLLSELFQSMTKLQIMVHLLITNVLIPANAQIYFSALLSLVTYDFVEMEGSIRNGFKLEDNLFEDSDDGLSNKGNMYALGYHSVFFLINISNMLMGLIF